MSPLELGMTGLTEDDVERARVRLEQLGFKPQITEVGFVVDVPEDHVVTTPEQGLIGETHPCLRTYILRSGLKVIEILEYLTAPREKRFFVIA